MLKQTIVMRTDLGMTAGDMITNGAEASMMAMLQAQQVLYYPTMDAMEERLSQRGLIEVWIAENMPRDCVAVDSFEELSRIFAKARRAGLTVFQIMDRRKSYGVMESCVLCIGPNESAAIDEITKGLKTL